MTNHSRHTQCEELQESPLKMDGDKDVCFHHYCSSQGLKVTTGAIRQEKDMKEIQIRKTSETITIQL